MRNLRNVAFEEVQIPAGLPLTSTCWDTENAATIAAFGPTPDNPTIELKRKPVWGTQFQTIASWDAPCPLPELECDHVLLLQYFSDRSETYLVLAGGDTVVVRDDPRPDQEKIEIIGSIDVGISAAAWSPEQELLVFVTREDTLVLVNKEFDPVAETTLTAEDLNASKHVSVGWGNKETQFQGKRAKAMRDPTVPEQVDEGSPSPNEDRAVSISWRGDGAYFAVNSIVSGERRVIRVFDREAVLDNVSEPVNGLEAALSWKPSGSLIASIKRSDLKAEVVFFERNGLRHGEFDLRLTKEELDSWASKISLSWNIDSTVLAVVFSDRAYLWTLGNYHYYLKQEVRLAPTRVIPTLRWHPENPLSLQLSSDESLVLSSYITDVSRGPIIPPLDLGAVAVIDGKKLKLTPLRQASVPPPMSFCEFTFDHNIVDCAFSQDGENVAVLTTSTLELCRWSILFQSPVNGVHNHQSQGRRYSTELLKQTVLLPTILESEMAARYTQIRFRTLNEVFILAPSQRGLPAQCKLLSLAGDIDGSAFEACKIPHHSQSFATDVQQSTLWTLHRTGTTLLSDEPSPSFEGAIPDTSIFQLKPPPTDELNGYHGPTYHRVTLTPNGVLQADLQIIASDCSSFVVTEAHIVFTTTLHLLKFVHLTEPRVMDVPGNTPEVDERCRSIEKGAKIVTVMPSSYAVVLQMPRGNLETIFPRVLVLSGIRQHIADLDYRTAFLACQTHQVDLNILHDYHPEIFAANVSKFVDELKKPARVDEFISKLKDEDVSRTLYRDTLRREADGSHINEEHKYHSTHQIPNKVNKVCGALITVLSSKPAAFQQTIITAHVCKRPPDLNAALMLVSRLRQTSTEDADLAISHLCFLTDTTRLYDAALALYDLEVALLVAQNAQRDPREYMPFLQSLQALPPRRREYTINHHLKNYAKALTSLHELSAHDEVEAYTIKHSLYTHALDLYKYSPSHLSTLTRRYAEHLSSQSQHLSAATLYDSLHDYTAAYPLYALAHAWREALTCATLISLPQAQLQTLAHSLATTLTDETRDFRSAAAIHADYLHDIPAAARLLCRGSYFAEAAGLLALHAHGPLISEIIDPSLLDKSSEILSLITDCRSQLTSQVPRILDVRRIKSSDPLAFFGGDSTANPTADFDGDVADNISLAATDSTIANQSLYTRYSSTSKFAGTVLSNVSRRTSKTRRREERKRARGKKGSVYEEEYLVASVGRLIERVNGTHEEVGRLVAGLVRRGMREQAGMVDEAMGGIQREMERARGEVWVEIDREGAEGEGVGVGVRVERRPRGADGVFWESQRGVYEDGEKKGMPEIKVWKKQMFSG